MTKLFFMNSNLKIAVIGAGPSGITTIKNLVEAGYKNVTCFEMNDQVGGNWVYSETEGHSSVFKTTHIISSRKFSEYTDFPMPSSFPDYPSQQELLQYFNDYVDHFQIRPYIQFNSRVSSASLTNNQWTITLEDQREYHFDLLIVCNGHHWDPRIPSYPGHFSGEILHSHSFKNNQKFSGKKVLVVGGGNSACDIAVEISRVAKKTSISMRRGYHFIPKFIMGMPSDTFYSKTLWIPKRIRLFLQKLVLRLVQGKYENYGLQTPDHDILETHATVNSELLYFIKHGKIKPKVNIQSFENNQVVFEDGSQEKFDAIIYATGYKITFPFFDTKVVDYENNPVELYNYCFHPHIQNLMFVGLLQPLGCIWPLADLQAQQIVQFLNGKWKLPQNLDQAIHRQLTNRPFNFIDTPRHKLEVDFHIFYKHLAKEIK